MPGKAFGAIFLGYVDVLKEGIAFSRRFHKNPQTFELFVILIDFHMGFLLRTFMQRAKGDRRIQAKHARFPVTLFAVDQWLPLQMNARSAGLSGAHGVGMRWLQKAGRKALDDL